MFTEQIYDKIINLYHINFLKYFTNPSQMKVSKSLLIFFPLFFLSQFIHSQLITSNPIFATADDSVEVIFDASLGSGGLENFGGDVYAHTGVITNLSTSGSDWKYVKTNWGVNIPATKLTRLGLNLYSLKISPSIRQYYGVPVSESILKIAFVFRSATEVNGSFLEGKTESGGDIYLDVYQSGLNIAINKPSSGSLILEPNDTFDIIVNSLNSDSLFLIVNNNLVASTVTNSISYTFNATVYGENKIKAIAKNSNSQVADSFSLFVRPPVKFEAMPAGMKDGINYIDGQSAYLVLFSPFKEYAFVVGDFNNWTIDTPYYMKRTPDSLYFWLKIENLIPQKEYIFQYFVDGNLKIGDPYAEKVSDPWNDQYITSSTYPNMLPYPTGKTTGIATVLQTNQPTFAWKHSNFTKTDYKDLRVYELLVRDFTANHSFKGVIDSLNYLKNLGINAIELMPVTEFEGNLSWGYNPNFYFAIDKYYGTKNDLKTLIDTCHSMGISVILDVVFNHSFGSSPYVQLWWEGGAPAANSPFFNTVAKHDYNVGFDMNHESIYTKRYVSSALQFYIEEFKFDGFRFDLSKGFTQKNTLGNTSAWALYDGGRVFILSSYADSIRKYNPDAHIIFEHFSDNTEETVYSNDNIMVWGNLNYNYLEGAMGYNSAGKSNFNWISYKNRGWQNPTAMGYMESHDEERLMYKVETFGANADDYNIKELQTGLERAELAATFFLTVPGPKMIWQFGELGYDISIDYNGRTGEKPIKWDYFNDENRHNLYELYSALNKLRAEDSIFNTQNFTIDAANAVKYIKLTNGDKNMIVAGNWGTTSGYVYPDFPKAGIWYDYFSGNSIEVKGADDTLIFEPGEFHIFTDKKLELPNYTINRWTLNKPLGGQVLYAYPNPTNGDLNLFINPESSEIVSVNLKVFDFAGNEKASTTFAVKDELYTNLSKLGITLQPGVYLIVAIINETAYYSKVIIF